MTCYPVKRDLLIKYAQECLNLFELVQDTPFVLRISKQSKKNYATGCCRNGVGYITVSYNRFRKITPRRQKEIIFHEVCHVVDWRLAECFPKSWKTDRWHGKHWKGLMVQVGLKPRTRYKIRKKRRK